MEKDKEMEKLLVAEDDDGLKRSSSNRFQVSRSEAVDESDTREKAESEPPLTQKQPLVERKSSFANGRFTIITDNNENKSEAPEEEKSSGSQESLAGPTKARGVHFSVGDSHEGRSRDSSDHNTTINMKSWRNMKTIEHPPIIDFYRNSIDIENGAMRPSMAQLIHGEHQDSEELADIEDFKLQSDELVEGSSQAISPKVEKFVPPQTQTRVKFGWFKGVFVRCLLNIFGVMLYLRISWVAGQAGVALGSLIVLLASLVTSITALSTCAICTNGDVKGGGAYFLISRSLGPEYGGAIGLIFSVANAVGGAMYVVGFAETVRDLLKEAGYTLIDGGLWDVRLIATITSFALLGIIFIGSEFESKMQMILLFVLLASLVNYVIGSFFPPNEEMILRGVTGYSWLTLQANLMPHFRGGEGFFTVFSVYFPAATGIMAGANISGDLQNPQEAIPKGTLYAIFFTSLIYLYTIVSTGSTIVRDADGHSYPMWNGSEFVPPSCVANDTCEYGLMNYFQIMHMTSLWPVVITAGIFAATLSSALASLVSAPKVFQAVCKDKLYPKIGYFAKTYGKNEEPKRAYILAFVICLAVIAIGDLNAIAPIISNFFLGSYALINYACFDQSFADSPGFRPAFKYYNKWVSLFGALLCVVVMFIISWVTAFITFVCFASLFVYLHRRKPNVNWGSSTQAHSYKNALSGMIKLSNTEEHVKNYRPQFLVLTGNPAARPSLVDFANSITKGTSLMICGYVIPYQPSERIATVMRKLDKQLNAWLHKRKIKSFYTSTANPSLRVGAQTLLQASGLGRLRPNIVLIGFKCNWGYGGPTETKLNELNDYFGTIQDAFDMNLGVCILRNGGIMGLDFSEAMKQLNVGETRQLNLPDVTSKKSITQNHSTASLRRPSSTAPSDAPTEEKDGNSSSQTAADSLHENNYKFEINEEEEEEVSEENEIDPLADNEDEEEMEGEHTADEENENKPPHVSDDDRKNHHTFSLRRRNSRRPTMEQRALLTSISRFQKKISKAVIDVWWLYDDGGLALLIPHLLTIPKSYLEGAKLRVFTISTSSKTMEQEQRSMAALLSKFRIDFSDVSVIADIGRKPNRELVSDWEKVITPWVAPDEDCPTGMTSVSELAAQKEKTYRQLRTRELLKQHSMNSDLIVLTLPVPRKGMISASLYMSWLDVMTAGMPPVLFVRGNQTSVLTFYS